MDTNFVTIIDGKHFNKFGEQIIDCRFKNCNNKTTMLGTNMCDRCWELYGRIDDNIKLTSEMLREKGYENRIDYK